MGPSAQTGDGVTVYLDSYYVHNTYSGCLEGVPSPAVMIESSKHDLERMWGTSRPILVDDVKVIMKERRVEILPRRCMMAWLNSYTAPSDEDGSHLFVVWFANEDAQNPLEAALQVVNAHGGWWKAGAKGWYI